MRFPTKTWRPVSQLGLAVGSMGLLLIAAMWIVVLALVGERQEQAVGQARKDASNLALAFEQHVIVSLNAIEQAMRLIADELHDSPLPRDLAPWNDRFRFLGDFHPRIAVIDPDGFLAGSNRGETRRIDVRDRAYFKAHATNGYRGTLIGPPVVGRILEEWTIQITRRLTRSDGSFAGILLFSIDPLYFARFYESIDVGRTGVVTLVGNDGIIRARSAGEAVSGTNGLGVSLLKDPLFRHLATEPVGTFVAQGTVDDVDRVFGYRAIDNHPLIVVVGFGLDEVLAAATAAAGRILVIASAVTLFLVLLLFLLVWEIERCGRRERELAAERAKLRAANAELDVRHMRLEQNNEALRASKERAEAASRSRATFLSMMSHELRTPLNAIIGFSDLIRQGEGTAQPAPLADYATAINEGGHHLLNVINNILDLSRLDAGDVELRREAADLVPLTRGVVRMLAWKARDQGLTLTVDVPDGAVPCRMDQTAMKQVLLNLLSNAIKFTRNGGAVSVAIGQAAGGAVVTVADTGIGITPDAMQRIFEPFTQGDSRAGRQFGGAGLGLTICRKLVDLHHGRLTIESEEGIGTVVRVWLPCPPDAAPAPAPRQDILAEG